VKYIIKSKKQFKFLEAFCQRYYHNSRLIFLLEPDIICNKFLNIFQHHLLDQFCFLNHLILTCSGLNLCFGLVFMFDRAIVLFLWKAHLFSISYWHLKVYSLIDCKMFHFYFSFSFGNYYIYHQVLECSICFQFWCSLNSYCHILKFHSFIHLLFFYIILFFKKLINSFICI